MNKVAEITGLSQSAISLIERNLRNPSLDVLLRISAALDIKLSEILAEAEKSARISNSKKS